MDYLDLEAERLRLDPQEAKVCFNCENCDGEIYEGNSYYEYNGDYLCEQCFDKKQEDEKRECERIAGDNDEN